MDFFTRARRYGEAVAVIDEFLGSHVREKVMERFSHIAGPLQRTGLRDPWEMIARAAKEAGVKKHEIQALRYAYLLRTKEFDKLPDRNSLSPEVVALLMEWGILQL
ncbi:MAG: hypothetical protein LOD85_10050 [Clostridia bacterium]|nr:hypothetical protein [Bacillota bacterium]MBO2522157.1 hypothetical protein [Bacillota bacterium]